MKEFWNKIWKHLLVLVVGVFVGLMINLPACHKLEPTVIEVPVHDTITVDSIRIQEKTEWKYRTVHDTLVTIVNDIDSIIVPIYIPIDHYLYKDTIETDSTSAELSIAYQGYQAKIDSVNLIYNYINKTIIIPEEKKRLIPFIEAAAGPVLNANFKEVNGAAIEVGGGVFFKNGWGIKANYEIDVLTSGVEHNIKAGIIKQF